MVWLSPEDSGVCDVGSYGLPMGSRCDRKQAWTRKVFRFKKKWKIMTEAVFPVPETSEIAKRAGFIRQMIAHKHAELNNADSTLGPKILGIIGLLTAIFLIGIVLILVALIWQYERFCSRPKLWREIATLETQLRGFEQRLGKTGLT